MTRIGRQLALVLIICFATMSCQAPEPQEHAEIGMVLHYRGVDDTILGRQFDLMEAMDADWVRIDLDWSAIESERGRYDWAVTDKLVDQAEAHGINVLGVIAFTPDWARSSTESAPENRRHQRPDRLSDYAEFTRMVVQRYAPRYGTNPTPASSGRRCRTPTSTVSCSARPPMRSVTSILTRPC